MQKTGIEWTDYSTNPLRAIDLATGKRGWSCTQVSAGCDHCYSAVLNARWGTRLPYDKAAESAVRWELNDAELRAIVASKATGVRVFVADMTDLFHHQVPDEWLERIFAVFALRQDLTFQVLTKRPQRALNWLTKGDPLVGRADLVAEAAAHLGKIVWDGRGDDPNNYLFVPGFKRGDEKNRRRWPGWPLPNVWLGTSVEDARVLHRLKPLGECPAAVRFLSCEPLIGSLGWNIADELAANGIGWVIAGGESGAGHRPVDPQWVRRIRDGCRDADVPFFFKQWGGKTPKSGGRLLDGVEHSAFPVVGAAVPS